MESTRWLTLRLSKQQSIGRDALKGLWASASETREAAVSRDDSLSHGVSYGLHAPTCLEHPRRAEMRMRQLLEEAGYVFTMSALAARSAVQGRQ